MGDVRTRPRASSCVCGRWPFLGLPFLHPTLGPQKQTASTALEVTPQAGAKGFPLALVTFVATKSLFQIYCFSKQHISRNGILKDAPCWL